MATPQGNDNVPKLYSRRHMLQGVAAVGGLAATGPVFYRGRPKPSVTGFSPTDAAPGARVAISGSGFTDATAVAFNGRRASFTVHSDRQITATVPPHATLGPIAVYSRSGTSTSRGAGFMPDNWIGSGETQRTGQKYDLEVNEYNSSATFQVATDLGPANSFRVINSQADTPLGGAPAAYPSFWRGNSWGVITDSDPFPLLVSSITGGGVVSASYGIDTSLDTSSSDIYNCSYDIFFVQSPSGNQSQGESTTRECMIWLDEQGVAPGGLVSSNVVIGGVSYSLYWGGYTAWYLANTPVSVLNVDVGLFAADMVNRGYLSSAWYLIDVQCGFEVWIGGTGLTCKSFSVNVTR